MFTEPSNLVEPVIYLNGKHTSLTVTSHNSGLPGGSSETPEDNFPHLQSETRAAELLQRFFCMVHFIIAVNNPRGPLLFTPVGEAAP